MKVGIGRMLLHSARCNLPSPKRQGMEVSNIPASSDFTSGHQLIRTHAATQPSLWVLPTAGCGVQAPQPGLRAAVRWTAGVTLLALHLHLLLLLCFLKACRASLLWGAATASLNPVGPGTLSGNPAELASEGHLWVLRKLPSQPGCGGDIVGTAVTKQTSPKPFTEQTDDFAVSTPELVLKPLVLQQQLLSKAISPALARPVNGAGRHLFWHDKEAEKFVGVQ